MPVLRSTIIFLRLALAEGALAQIYSSLAQGMFLTGFALLLDASPLTLGYLAALPFLGNFLAVAFLPLIQRVGNYKTICVISQWLARTSWLLAALIVLVSSRPTKLTVLVSVATLSYVISAPAGVCWWSWVGRMVPEKVRGGYFHTRNLIMGVTGLAVATVASHQIDRWLAPIKRRVAEAEGVGLMEVTERMLPVGEAQGVFLAVILAGAAVGILGILLLMRQPYPRFIEQADVKLGSLLDPLHDRQFRPLILYTAVWGLGAGISLSFYVPFMLEGLGMEFSQVVGYQWIAAGSGIVLTPLLMNRVSQMGELRTLRISLTLLVAVPVILVLARPDRLYPVYLDAALSGILWPLGNLAIGNLLISDTPENSRAAYLAWQAAAGGLAFLIAALAGGALVSAGDGLLAAAGGGWMFMHSGYQFALLAGTLLRGASLFPLSHYQEVRKPPSSRPAGTGKLLYRLFGLERIYGASGRMVSFDFGTTVSSLLERIRRLPTGGDR